VPHRSVVIVGAAGRDFHNFNTVFRDNPAYEVVAFTAAQIPGIAGRRYPPALAGRLYPRGIPIVDESQLETLIARRRVDWVYFSYSDVPHAEVMHIASRALAAGASFGLLGPRQTMLRARVPVIAVCAVRTGAGKSPVGQWIVSWMRKRGHRVAVLRHPMPYGDLARQAVQRFATYDDLDAAKATIEEREEYEPYVRMGVPVYAGVDYAAILRLAQRDADLVLWDGGNNDFPFIRPDLHLTLVDPLRPGHETAYHPGETNLRMAHALVISKANSVAPEALKAMRRRLKELRPGVPITLGDLAPSAPDPERMRGQRVIIVGDGPTLTHGGMAWGAGTIVARQRGAVIVSPREAAVGELRATLDRFPHIETELPAMGYSPRQVRDLQASLRRAPAALILDATPVDLARLITVSKPMLNVSYAFRERAAGLTKLLKAFERAHLRGG
jgi:predicted GTPase